MNEQELNKLKRKLAKFAGFKKLPTVFRDSSWMSPDGIYMLESRLPNFPHSLDDCFKRLPVPSMSVGKDIDENGEVYFIGVANLDGLNNSYGEDKHNPALALCLAIEKLIDGEVKNG